MYGAPLVDFRQSHRAGSLQTNQTQQSVVYTITVIADYLITRRASQIDLDAGEAV